MAGICGDGGDETTKTLACFAYPKDRFKDKPAFSAAAFFVAEVEESTTEKDCLQGSPNWNVNAIKTATINGVVFKVFEISDNWAGGGQSGPIYRTFHDNRCYELGVQNAIVRGGYDAETLEKFTKQDADQVRASLTQALNSFIFSP